MTLVYKCTGAYIYTSRSTDADVDTKKWALQTRRMMHVFCTQKWYLGTPPPPNLKRMYCTSGWSYTPNFTVHILFYSTYIILGVALLSSHEKLRSTAASVQKRLRPTKECDMSSTYFNSPFKVSLTDSQRTPHIPQDNLTAIVSNSNFNRLLMNRKLALTSQRGDMVWLVQHLQRDHGHHVRHCYQGHHQIPMQTHKQETRQQHHHMAGQQKTKAQQ